MGKKNHWWGNESREMGIQMVETAGNHVEQRNDENLVKCLVKNFV
jgi:hypothetical protein